MQNRITKKKISELRQTAAYDSEITGLDWNYIERRFHCDPILPAVFVAPAAAAGGSVGAFSATAPSVPAGDLLMSLDVREETPVTAQPAHVAAELLACADAVTSFSGIERKQSSMVTKQTKLSDCCYPRTLKGGADG